MTRYISFFLLVAFIIIIGIVFYRVMSGFLLPLFLAVILAVIFRPLYLWVFEKSGKREFISSAITTTFVTVVVVAPLALIGTLAVREAITALSQLQVMVGQVDEKAEQLRDLIGVNKPFNATSTQSNRNCSRQQQSTKRTKTISNAFAAS